MSFLTGKTKEMAPGDIIDFRKQLESILSAQGGASTLFPSATDLTPFQKMFEQNRAVGLAQAKESAGNLTGSGFANAMGSAAGRSILEENAFLADLMNRNQQANAQRWLQLAGGIPGMGGQMAYQPGFMDYLLQGGSQVASAAIMAGA